MKTRLTIVCLLLSATSAVFAGQYPDSIKAAGAQEFRIEKGLNFEIAGGAGIGRYEFRQMTENFMPPHVQNKLGMPVWNASLGINYYFVNWFGLGTGVQFSTYANNAQVNLPIISGGTDYQGDTYQFTSKPEGLTEREDMYMVEVPIALRFRAIKRVVGFQSAIGAKIGFPMHDSYRLSEGTLKNEVEYPDLGLPPMSSIGMVQDEKVAGMQGACLTSLTKVNYAAYAEVGMLFRLHQRLDLSLAVAATYYVNNVLNDRSTAELFPVVNNGEFSIPSTAGHQGVLMTREVSSLHPWNVLLKVGLIINTGKTKAQRDYDKEMKAQRKAAKEAAPAPEPEPAPQPVPDPEPKPEPTPEPEPVVEPKHVVEPEPVVEPAPEPEPEPQPAPKPRPIPEIRDGSLHFVLDQEEPIIENPEALEEMAAALREHPESKIRIVGHTCTIGRAAYNIELGRRRAQAVADALRKLGVPDEQMIIESKGESEPLVQGPHDLSIDRRVEIIPVE